MAQPYAPPCLESRIEAEPCPRAAGRETDAQTKRSVLATCILASSMACIDGSALTVALPALKADLGGGVAAAQWVLTGYILALAAFTMAGGALADRLGRARVLTAGAVAFAAASAACALAPSAGALVAASIAQGLAAAAVTPASLALIGETFPQDERNRAIGVWAAASALTTAGGPVLGGWLTEAFSWRSVFWINIPIAAIAIGLLALAPRRAIRKAVRFDIVGVAILTFALGGLALSITGLAAPEGEPDAAPLFGSGAALGFGAAGALAMGAFVWWERRTDHPMLPGYLFQSRAFVSLNAATIAIYGGLSIMFFVLPFALIEERGLSATNVGLAFLPFTLSVGFLSRAFGGLADRVGERPLLVGGAATAAGGFALFAATAEAPLWASLLAPMTVAGLGFALLVAPLTAAVMNAVDTSDEGLASGVNNTASRIAQMLGVAVAAAFVGSTAAFVAGFWVAAGLAALAAGLFATLSRATPAVETAEATP